MKHKIMAAVCCIALLCTLTGCQLAQENAGANTYADRLIGGFITSEYLDLFDFEGYLNDNLGNFQDGDMTISGNSQEYEGRLYATLTTRTLTNEKTGETTQTEEFVFPNTSGIVYFTATVPAIDGRDSYTTSISDPAISDGHISVKAGDEANSTMLEGTIYVSPTNNARTYYFNPVYQSADGSVYLTSGSGISVDGMDSEGFVMSQTMDSTTTVTENGKAKTENTSIKFSIGVMFTPEKIVILQMGADSEILSRTEYAPDVLPESITPEKGTDYIIAETHKLSVTEGVIISRDIYSKDAESMETFLARDDGICEKHWTQIKWPE